MWRPLSLVLVAALLLVAGALFYRPATAQPGQKLRVVTSTGIHLDLVRQVGGDKVDAFSVVPQGADPHTYQPTPRDIQALQGTKVAIWNGLGLDATAQSLVDAQGLPGLTTVILTEGIDPIAGGDEDEEDADHEGHEHEEAGGNPHMWLDPTLAMTYVERIRDALSEADPANAATYEQNATRYTAQIAELDNWAVGQIATIPANRRKLVTFHDAFPYLARHYELDLVGVVLKSPGREPSAQEVAALVTDISQHQIPTVYAEPQFNARILELAAKDAGVQVKRLYSDAFDDQVMTYLDLMRYDITSLVDGLR
jgi:zinc/manganese transport system substrate-binding protein/manganese/iron transport system substrate-binding protein